MADTEQHGFESRPRLHSGLFERTKRLTGTEKKLHHALNHGSGCWCRKIKPYGCSIYAVASIEGPRRYKFGRADNPRKRFQAICSSSPVALELLLYGPGGENEEERIHVWLRELHIHGEWFSDGPLVQALLGALEADIEETHRVLQKYIAGPVGGKLAILERVAAGEKPTREASPPSPRRAARGPR